MATLVTAVQSTAATTYTAATEVAALTFTDVFNTLDAEGQGNVISATVAFTAGATAGTVTARVRQGVGLTGPIVATIPLSNTVISTPYAATFDAYDPLPATVGSGNAGQPTYTVTLQVTGSNGTGTYASGTVSQISGQE